MTYQNGAVIERVDRDSNHYSEVGLRDSEITHRIANSLSLLASSISLRARQVSKQSGPMSSAEVSTLLDEISARITSVAHLHRDISTRPEAAHLDLNAHLRKLCGDLIAAVAQPGQFELRHDDAGACAIKTDVLLPICMIVIEVVTNALKYSHPSGVRGVITIGCRHEADDSVLIEVADDGIGLPEGFDPATDGGLGSHTIRLLARQLDADTAFVPRPIGTCFRLRLPASTVG